MDEFYIFEYQPRISCEGDETAMVRSQKKKRSSIGMVRTPVNREEYADGYGAKLVKYIPAEVLAAFIPLVALADKISPSKEIWLWVTVGIAGLCVLGYSRWQATDVLWAKINAHGDQVKGEAPWTDKQRMDEYERLRPHPYFYILALIAFAAWALGTAKPARGLIGMDATQGEFVVAAVAFALPLADVTLHHFSEWRADRKVGRPKGLLREHAAKDAHLVAQAGNAVAQQRDGKQDEDRSSDRLSVP